MARERGVRLVISSDAHSRHAFAALRWGIMVARRAWLEATDVEHAALEDFRSASSTNMI
jgi:DNA polymerase (family 10)